MAKTWTVTPNDGVTAATDGVYVFPANDTYDDKVYTVTLKDTDCNCVAHKTIKVKGKSAPTACTCSITSDYGTTSSKISGDQHTNVKIGTFTSYLCSGTTTFSYSSGDADFVSNFSYTGNDIYANVSSNDSYTNSRMAIYNASCGGSLTIYQANREELCPTQSNIINTNTTVVNSGGTQVAVMQILKDSTYTTYTITADSTSSSYVSNINEGAQLHDNWYVVLADVTANPGTSDRSLYFDVVVEGPTLGTGCTYNNVKVTQNGGCPTEFIKGFTGTIGATGGYCVALGRFKNNLTDYTTAFTVTVSDGSSMSICQTTSPWAEDASWNLVQITVPENTSENSRTITITCTLSDTCSESIAIVQSGATQTCGCNSITVNGTYEADPTPVTPDDGKITVKVDLNDGTTSPAIHFVDSSNTQLLGVVRYTTDTTTTSTWRTTGTCSKIKLVEMGGNYTRLSITIQNTGQAPVTILDNATLPSTSGSFINLTRSFNVLDYYDSNKSTVTLTFR